MAKRGRPSLSPGEPSTRLSLALSVRMYDEAFAASRYAREKSVPEWIRKLIGRELRNKKLSQAQQ